MPGDCLAGFIGEHLMATQLPLPIRLEPVQTKRSLMANVRIYFYSLYNQTDGKFRTFLASVSNDDAITGNRLFDRHDAVGMIKGLAKEAKDQATGNAKDGEIYKCLVNLMRANQLGLKIRRAEYQRLTHQEHAPAE
jgi:hypothetical protein